MKSSTPSEDSQLAESAYDIINTDGESQDDRMTNSTSSLDIDAFSRDRLSRPDDIQSLAGSEDASTGYPSDDDDDDDDDGEASQHTRSSIAYADEVLGSPSANLSANSIHYLPSTPPVLPLRRSIEFSEEDAALHRSKISVKHTIREFSEEETTAISDALGLPDGPNRLVATIRQTMSHGCLTNREPLRILYVGDPVGQTDIVYKISSAIAASGRSDAIGRVSCRSDSGSEYTIVPVSFPDADGEPEIELVQTSAYKIRVERCTSAKSGVSEGDTFSSDTVHSITIDDDKTYTSAFSAGGSVVQPQWSLPHIAVFYLAETDTKAAEATRNAAWQFMRRHGVPYIFISQQQMFTTPIRAPWKDFVDQHAVHLCVESRDPERSIPPRRLPIDLSSFLTIDARQMNRNLAYLTGRVEAIPVCESQTKGDAESTNVLHWAFGKLQEHSRQRSWLFPVLVGVFSIIVASAIASFARTGGYTPVDLEEVVAFTTPLSTTPRVLYSSTVSISTATTTVTINLTSTKTLKPSTTESTASIVASALQFGGFLSDKPQGHAQEPDAKTSACSVEIHSPTEMLVRLPAGKKAAWLAKGAITIDVLRGSDSIDSKLSAVDEGILVEIPKQDAYGTLNVTIITTRKPKMNETFAVNFGKALVVEALEAGLQIFQDVAHKVAGTAEHAAQIVEDTCVPYVATEVERLRGDAWALLNVLKDVKDAVKGFSSRLKQQAEAKVKDSLNSATLTKTADEARHYLSRQVVEVEIARDEAILTVLEAQITSRLWWLKLRGKLDQHAEYERKAAVFLKKKRDEFRTAREAKSSPDNSNGARQTRIGCRRQNKYLAKSQETAKRSLWTRMRAG